MIGGEVIKESACQSVEVESYTTPMGPDDKVSSLEEIITPKKKTKTLDLDMLLSQDIEPEPSSQQFINAPMKDPGDAVRQT